MISTELIKNIIYKIPIVKYIYSYNRQRRNRWVKIESKKITINSKVLDIGAGNCPYRSYFSHCDYKAHDFHQLDENQLQDSVGYGKIDYISDILAIPVEDNTFDVIICTEVIEHVPYPILAIKQYARILRPGGVLLITAPLQSGIHQIPYHFYGGFTKFWYMKILSEYSFSEIEINENGGLFTSHMAMGLTMLKLLLNEVFKVKTWKVIPSILLIVIYAPFIALIFPILSFALDHIYKERNYTAGYHVKAIKCS